MSWHRVMHTPSTAYTEYGIHRVQHTRRTAYTEYSIHRVQYPCKIVCLPFILMITSWRLNVASASGMLLPESSKVKSHCHIATDASKLTDEKSLRTRRAVHRLPPTTRPNSLDHRLQVYLQIRLIMASKCISKFARSRPPSASPNSLDLALQLHLQTCSITAFKGISKLAWLWSPKSLDHALPLHVQTRSSTASKVHLHTRLLTAPVCIPEFTRSSFSGGPRISLKHPLLAVQIYRVLMGSYIDT